MVNSPIAVDLTLDVAANFPQNNAILLRTIIDKFLCEQKY